MTAKVEQTQHMTAPNSATTDFKSFFSAGQQLALRHCELPSGMRTETVQHPNFRFPSLSQDTETADLVVALDVQSVCSLLLDSLDKYSWQNVTRPKALPEIVSAYDDRINNLEEQAATEGYFLNSGSKETFQRFFQKNPFIRLGRLVLLENGNLRAVWKDKNGSHIGLQFLDNLSIQYVLFKRRKPGLPVSRAYGRDTIDGLIQQITALELREVLYA